MTETKVLVLGGTGFIGRHVIQRLLQDADAVRLLSRTRNAATQLCEAERNVELLCGDFQDEHVIQSALRGMTHVIHLISTIGPAAPIEDGKRELELTVLPTVRLMEHAAKAGVKKIVFVSSGGTVYGNTTLSPIVEDTVLAPVSVYGLSKMIAENYVRFYSHKLKISESILRVANPFGPGQDPGRRQGIVAVALDCLLNQKPFEIVGDGNAIRDYVFVEDVADGVVRALHAADAGTYNISSGVGMSVLGILELIESVTGLALEKRFLPARPTDVASSVLSNRLAFNAFGWTPTTSIKDGISRTWEWVRSLS